MAFTKIRRHILVLLFSIILSGVSLVSLVKFTDPNTGGTLVHLALYLTVFFTVSGIATLVGISIRKIFFYGLYAANFKISLRQGVLVGLFAVTLLALSAFGLLIWWVAGLLILFITVLEIFFNL